MTLLLKKVTPLDIKKNGLASLLTHKFISVYAVSDPAIDGDMTFGYYKSVNNIVYSTNLFITASLAKDLTEGYKVLTDYFTPKFIFKNNVISPIVYTQKNESGFQVMVRCKYNFQPEDTVEENLASVNLDKIYKNGDVLLDIRPTLAFHVLKS